MGKINQLDDSLYMYEQSTLKIEIEFLFNLAHLLSVDYWVAPLTKTITV